MTRGAHFNATPTFQGMVHIKMRACRTRARRKKTVPIMSISSSISGKPPSLLALVFLISTSGQFEQPLLFCVSKWPVWEAVITFIISVTKQPFRAAVIIRSHARTPRIGIFRLDDVGEFRP
jgi:hypothetical protein